MVSPKKKVAKANPHKVAAINGGEKRQRRKKRTYTLISYIYKILKQVHPDLGASSAFKTQTNVFMNLLANRISQAAQKLTDSAGLKTISSRSVQAAVGILFGDELGKHAVSHATRAVTKYVASAGGVGDGRKKRPVSSAERAELSVPPSYMFKILKKQSNRVSFNAAVYLAGSIDYIISELCELSGNAARDLKRSRIGPKAMTAAIKSDEELSKLALMTGYGL